jgi:PAS domain-containing protein
LDALVNSSLELSRVIERRHSRERLRESQLQIIEAQHIARLGSWEWDIAGNKVSLSQELFRIFDLAEGEFEGTYQAFLDKFHPDDVERAQIEFMRAYEHGIPFNFQHRIIRSNREQRIIQTRGRAVHNKQDQPVRIIGTAQDITEMVAIEMRMQAQDEMLENVLAQSQIILWSIDQGGELRLSRRGGLAALGIPEGDQLGNNIFKILPADHPLIGYVNHALEKRSVHVDYKVEERIYDLRILPQMYQQENVTV